MQARLRTGCPNVEGYRRGDEMRAEHQAACRRVRLTAGLGLQTTAQTCVCCAASDQENTSCVGGPSGVVFGSIPVSDNT